MGNQNSSDASGARGEGTGDGDGGGGRNPSPPRRMTLKDGYDQLVHAFIRPARAQYSVSDLGPTSFRVGSAWFERTDLSLINPRGLKLACSFWEPKGSAAAAAQAQAQAKAATKTEEAGDGQAGGGGGEAAAADSTDAATAEMAASASAPAAPAAAAVPALPQRPCVVYLHGNASCRAGVLEMLPNLLMAGFSVFALDFSGCGLSEGKYISLGFYEKEDVATAVEFLRNCGRVSTIGLWGHSMGAATSMMFAHSDPSVAAMVLDCAFADLQQLAHELVKHAEKQGFKIPKAIASIALHFVRGSIKKRAKFDIFDVKPVERAHESFIPAFFIAAEEDEMIDPHHSRDLHEAYGGDKNISTFRGQHCSARPKFIHDSVIIFLSERLFVGSAAAAAAHSAAALGTVPVQLSGGQAPWWAAGGVQPQLHRPQSWLVDDTGDGEEDELDALGKADLEMLEQAIIESLRDGGGVQEAGGTGTATSTGTTALPPPGAGAQSATDEGGGSSSAAAVGAVAEPVTPAQLMAQGKTAEEIDEMLLQQALSLSLQDAGVGAAASAPPPAAAAVVADGEEADGEQRAEAEDPPGVGL